MPEYILLTLSIPFFLILMAVEFYITKKRKGNYFGYGQSILNISVGIAERWLYVFLAGFYYFAFQYIQDHFGLFHIRSNALTWILLFLLTDFIWYWYHRLSHEINLFWAAHIVHHQSEDFNLTVSARITVFQSLLRSLFWMVLPLIGFPAGMVSLMLLVHGLYPFFIHTRVIGKLGWLEYIFVTPSHHRVHHASNEQYLDKNYGDILIIWDKLFGTFTEEKEEPVYGLTHPLQSHSFLWQHFHYYLEIWMEMKKTPGTWKKLKILFGEPKFLSEKNRGILERSLGIRKRSLSSLKPLKAYINGQIIVALLVLVLFYLFQNELEVEVKILLTILILVTLINCGAILEQRKWIFYLEVTRFFILLYLLSFYFDSDIIYFIIALGLVVAFVAFESIERWYFKAIYRSTVKNG